MIIVSIFEKELESYLDPEEIHTIINRVYKQLSNTCSFVFQKGKRTGSVCGRRCPGEMYCKMHKKQIEKKYCTMILKSGKNKGKKCCRTEHSNGYCKIHQSKNIEEQPEPEQAELEQDAEPEQAELEQDAEPEPLFEETYNPYAEPNENDTKEQTEQIEQIEQKDDLFDTSYNPYEQPIEELDTEYSSNWDINVHNILKNLSKLPEQTNIQAYGNTIPNTSELVGEDDEYIDTSDLTEVYNYDRECQYWVKNQNYFCCEPTTKGSQQFCKDHLRFTGKIEFKDMLFHTQPLYEIMPCYYRLLGFSGQYYYPRLLLAAKPTSEGLVVIGRLLARQWIIPLTEREIKRCHNNGLLYKVLSHDIVHYNYHIPDIERIEGTGFTSYDQIRFERPRLYIKYWKIWNQQINIRKEYIAKWSKFKGNKYKWTKEHFNPLPDWEKVKIEFKQRGLENIIIPAPSVEQVLDKEWNPWTYCEDWVKENQPQNTQKIIFPPYYLDYPNPYAMFCRPFEKAILRERNVDYDNPEHTKHYNYGPTWWNLKIEGKKIEYINTSYW